jgi:hypothetical protein
MAHVGKYVDWRLIQRVPFEEDVELFAAAVDGSLCATVDAEYSLPDGAMKPHAAGAAEIGPWYYGGTCPRCGALAPIAQDGRKGQASILHYLRGAGAFLATCENGHQTAFASDQIVRFQMTQGRDPLLSDTEPGEVGEKAGSDGLR